MTFDSSFQLSFLLHGSDSFGGGHFLETILALFDLLLESGLSAFLTKAFPGIHALPNLHPLIVHFPIALFCTFFLLELVSVLRRSDRIYHAASWTLFVGIVSAILAVILGRQAAQTVPHAGIVHSIIDQHESYAITAIIIALVLAAWRVLAKEHLMTLSLPRFLHITLAVGMVLMIFLTADLGGLMVYKFGVGIH